MQYHFHVNYSALSNGFWLLHFVGEFGLVFSRFKREQVRLSEDEEVCFFSIRCWEILPFFLRGIFQGIVGCISFEFKWVAVGSDRSPTCLLVLFFFHFTIDVSAVKRYTQCVFILYFVCL